MDAYTTMFRFIKTFPYIMTIWGADIKLTDEIGWEKVWTHSVDVAKTYGLCALSIKSNFREILNERRLTEAVQKRTGDNWWHGFQSGIGIIGHASPLSYVLGLSNVCIASSFPKNMKGLYTCASDPSIDEMVHFGACHVIHDGYELNRQQKIQSIIQSKKLWKKSVFLRVCWESKGGSNCCACEKCYRTILELVSEGEDPNAYGFTWDKKHIRQCKWQMKYKITIQPFDIAQFYPIIQERMRYNQKRIADFNEYQWFLNIDFKKFNNHPIKRLRYKLSRTKWVIAVWNLFFMRS